MDVEFHNENGERLSGVLDLPVNGEAHNYVLFAHCFTCNKDFLSARNISRSLTAKGFGVLRFDFTGLGESEGDFGDSNFSGNVEDLLAAASYLEREYQSPALLVGHSLGGAAVIIAGKQLPNVKAIATIGTPSKIAHVTHIFGETLPEIRKKGEAMVSIGGRPFNITRQFIKDLETNDLKKIIKRLGKSVLILHSPQDRVVEIKNAEEIYIAARHPKSFISLDGADHLLSRRKDSVYAGEIIGSWALKYLEMPAEPSLSTSHNVVAQLGDTGFTTHLKAGNHRFIADEPLSFGGNDFGPSPYDLLSAGLAACTSMTIQMYARRKNWKIDNVETHVNHSKLHALDCEDCTNTTAKIDHFERRIIITGKLEESQLNRLLQIADKCPVHKTLHAEVKISSEIEHKG
ncbi:bifunctional alpha/beta hydrolase/OsmC family protein [soil metagenome]